MKIEYTDEMTKDLYRCADDPIYFIETHVKIKTVDGVTPFILHEYQKEIIRTYKDNKRVSCMVGRQMGKTVLNAAFILWFSMFNSCETTMVIANKYAVSTSIMQMIRDMYELVPDYIKPEAIENNRQCLKLDNKSRIITRACTASACRGMSTSLLVIDEAAYISNNVIDEFWAAVLPTLYATDGRIIMSSTMNTKDDLFYKIRENADDNGFATCMFNWRDCPGRTEEWRIATIEAIGYKNFYKEHECEVHSINELYCEIEQLRYELRTRNI